MGGELSGLNWFDISVIAVVFMSTILAFFRGFIKALFSLITWVGAGVSSVLLYPTLKESLSGTIDSEKTLAFTALLLGFITVFIILAIINSKIIHSLRKQRKGVVDRSLGFAFGFARGVFIVCAVFFSINLTSQMLNYTDEEGRFGPSFMTQAKTYNLLGMSTEVILAVLPEDFPEMVVARIDSLKDKTFAAMRPDLNEDMTADLNAGNGLPRPLSKDEKKIMLSVKNALPKENYDKIKESHQGHVGGLSHLDRIAVFRELLESYKQALEEGKVEKDSVVSENNINILDQALNGTKIDEIDIPKDEGIGYKELNIRQLDRLVDSVD